MPTLAQYETVEQQCKSMQAFGYSYTMDFKCTPLGAIPRIVLSNCCKHYHFSDPDIEVVIKQLTQLYRFIKQRHLKSA